LKSHDNTKKKISVFVNTEPTSKMVALLISRWTDSQVQHTIAPTKHNNMNNNFAETLLLIYLLLLLFLYYPI